MASTRVWLIRHADVLNPKGVLYGFLPGFPLSPLGREQAQALGERFKGSGLELIIHSPLDRARETAELLASRLEPKPELVQSWELREAEFSRYLQGIRYWQIPLRRPRWWIHQMARGWLPGDEPVEAMAERVLGVARAAVRERPGGLIALVSHADPIQAVWVHLDRRQPNQREMYRKQVMRAGALRLDLEDDQAVAWEYVAPPEVAVSAGA